MGVFDFLKRKQSGPSLEAQVTLVEAMACLSAHSSPANREAFGKALFEAILLLAVRDVPPSIGAGANVLDEDTEVSILRSSTPEGLQVLFAFTSPAEVHARSPESAFIGMPSRAVLEMVLEDDYDLLAINPGGDVIELARNEVEDLLK